MMTNCRLVAFLGLEREYLGEIWHSVRASAKHDYIAESLNLGFSSHDDGTGYVFSCQPFTSQKTIYKRYVTPAWLLKRLSIPGGCPKVNGMFHIRKALNEAPLGLEYVQPILVRQSHIKLYVAITGGISEDFWVKNLGHDFSDAQRYAALIKSKIKKHMRKPDIKKMAEIIHSLNKQLASKMATSWCFTSAVLGIRPYGKRVFLVLTRIIHEEQLEAYCELFRVKMGKTWIYASSTIALNLEKKGYMIREIGINTSILEIR